MRPEDVLQRAVCDYLAKSLPSTAWFTAIPNGSVLAGDARARAMQMNKLKATGLRPGAPDLLIVWESQAICVELKAGKGKPSKAQEDTADHLRHAGALYTIARSVDEVEAYLRACGVPVRARLAA